jgi:hypothetical protein
VTTQKMSAMKNKRLQKFLLLLVVAIWGMVALRVYGTMASGESEGTNSGPASERSRSKRSAFLYKADVRDPFYFAASAHRQDSTRRAPVAPKVVWMPPPVKLTGILQNKAHKKTAILENATGDVFFLSEGDTLSGAKILKIKAGEVSYLFQKQKSQWILEAQ